MPPNLLSILGDALTRRLAAYGLVQVDRADFAEVGWLEYQADGPDTPRRLSVTFVSADGTVRAELWRPRDLARPPGYPEVERAIDQQQTWHFRAGMEMHALAREIAIVIFGWTEPRSAPDGQR